MTFAEVITPGGYPCGEVASAMQKCIRRGLEEDALFWATELDLAGFGEYVWKRLRIITSEDVGLAAPGLVADIRALYDNWLDQRKKKDERNAPERLFLIHAIILLCRSAKSRMVDHALIVMYEGQRSPREIPDFALDRHTARGRKRRRGWKHFWEEGAFVSLNADVQDIYIDEAREIRRDAQMELEGL